MGGSSNQKLAIPADRKEEAAKTDTFAATLMDASAAPAGGKDAACCG